jgi:hypothetical protein
MAQTVANLTEVLKEAWTDEKLVKQYFTDAPLLDRLTKFQAGMSKSKIGEKAIVPIQKGIGGGYTSVGSAGGSLNPADEAKVDAAEYTLVYHWHQIALETGALNQSAGGAASVVDAKMLEVENALDSITRNSMRQVATNSDGIIAACDTGGASATVELLVDSATSYGFQAIQRGWLQPGMLVDVGTTADTDALATGSEIVSVKEDSADPDIVISNSISTTSGTHFVYAANPNSATLANVELNGFRSMFGSNTSSVGGLDPDTTGEEFWKPALVDTTTTVFSLDLALNLQRAVRQKTRTVAGSEVWTSYKQEANFYSLLQNQVRFTGDGNLGAGQVAPKWNGMSVHADADILDQDWYHLTMNDVLLITGERFTGPTWASDIEGAGGRLRWGQGTTAFSDAVVFPYQVGIRRRNSHAAAIGLTA